MNYFRCKTKIYLKNLPSVSVVIPFFEEHWSTLLRSVHSIINRTPPELLQEIILVDDYSQIEFLGKKLDEYIKEFLPKVKVVRLPKRLGLILARLAGAKRAKSEVLVFFDSHIEVNYNWLPPLLEPIVENRKTVVCPFIDVIQKNDFHYRAHDEGRRGIFDWEFKYRRSSVFPEDLTDRTKPFRSPVMAGGLFAIDSDFFWDIGGYDEGLDTWGGEQFEISFKIWMCGGEILDAPCSRARHVYRGGPGNFKRKNVVNTLFKNYKRVAEVWMDEYKDHLYVRNPTAFAVDAGDLTYQKAVRNHLQCKSFKWFIEEIAFDVLERYPLQMYAYGAIQSEGNTSLCVDSLKMRRTSPASEPGLTKCAQNISNPHYDQYWIFSGHKDVRSKDHVCLDVTGQFENTPVKLYACNDKHSHQLWHYDPENKFLIEQENKRCLEADAEYKKLLVNVCANNNPRMKWNFGVVNYTNFP